MRFGDLHLTIFLVDGENMAHFATKQWFKKSIGSLKILKTRKCWLLLMAKLTTARAAQVAKRGSSRASDMDTASKTEACWRSLVHLYLYNLHHNSSRIPRFLLRFCVSIQWHSWRFTLFILFWSVNKSANVRFPRFYVSFCDGPCDLLHVVLHERRQNQVGSFNWSDCKMALLRAFQCAYDWWVGSREEC